MTRWGKFFKGVKPNNPAMSAGSQAVSKFTDSLGLVQSSDDVEGPASSVTSRIAIFDGTSGKLIADGGKTISEVDGDVVGPASSTNNNVALFDGTTGKLLKEGGTLGTGDVVGPGSATDNAMCVFDGTTGKLIGVGTIQDDGSIVTFTGGDVRAASLPDSDPSVLGQLYTDGTIGPATPKHLMVSGGP
tara:strand:+ start:47 stop:610 length:564 start_codon:yes stop_codon:yes gene_type:complete